MYTGDIPESTILDIKVGEIQDVPAHGTHLLLRLQILWMISLLWFSSDMHITSKVKQPFVLSAIIGIKEGEDLSGLTSESIPWTCINLFKCCIYVLQVIDD